MVSCIVALVIKPMFCLDCLEVDFAEKIESFEYKVIVYFIAGNFCMELGFAYFFCRAETVKMITHKVLPIVIINAVPFNSRNLDLQIIII